MALDKLTLLDETVINNTATNAATTVVNNSAQTNYISFPVASATPTSNGWRTYADSAATSPVDGTGGSPNTTLTQNTVSPLNSTGDFRLNKSSGASRQGEGISTDFTIANRHCGKVLQVSFDYELVSGTLAFDDLRLYIIQDPTGTPLVIEPVNVSLQGSVVPIGSNNTVKLRHLATFQTHISITSYRLCVHVSTSTNSSQIVDFNNFRVWETTQSVGSIITDWVSYTPTLSGFVTSSQDFQWRRVGSDLEVQGKWTTSTASGVEIRFPLPNGLVIDSSKIPSLRIVGMVGRSATASAYFGAYAVAEPSVSYLTLSTQTSGLNSLTKRLGTDLVAVNGVETMSITATVPIAGWGSSVAMSSDSGDGRIVAATYNSISGSYSIGSSETIVKFENRLSDSHSAYSGSTGFFTSPVSGWYQINASIVLSTNTLSNIKIKLDNTTDIVFVFGANNRGTVSTAYYLNAGQTLSVYATANTSTLLNNAHNLLSIYRISAGSQTIGTNETVVATATKESGSWSDNTIVTWSNKQIDTHGALDISTGEFTCPMNGKYLITANLTPNNYFTGSGNTTNSGVQIRKNATLIARSSNYWAGASTVLLLGMACTHIVDCIAGNKLSIYGVGTWTVETGKFSHLSIMRIGI